MYITVPLGILTGMGGSYLDSRECLLYRNIFTRKQYFQPICVLRFLLCFRHQLLP